MKNRNHSQLKEQENSPEGTNNETDTKFKKEVKKIPKKEFPLWRSG